jgi:arylsulfatase A-like enzyme
LPAKSLQELGLDPQRVMQPMSPVKRQAHKHRFRKNRYFHKAMSSAGIGKPSPICAAKLLSDAGYATALFGKWHLGDTEGACRTIKASTSGGFQAHGRI